MRTHGLAMLLICMFVATLNAATVLALSERDALRKLNTDARNELRGLRTELNKDLNILISDLNRIQNSFRTDNTYTGYDAANDLMFALLDFSDFITADFEIFSDNLTILGAGTLRSSGVTTLRGALLGDDGIIDRTREQAIGELQKLRRRALGLVKRVKDNIFRLSKGQFLLTSVFQFYQAPGPLINNVPSGTEVLIENPKPLLYTLVGVADLSLLDRGAVYFGGLNKSGATPAESSADVLLLKNTTLIESRAVVPDADFLIFGVFSDLSEGNYEVDLFDEEDVTNFQVLGIGVP